MRSKDELNPKKPRNILANLSQIMTVAALALLISTLFFDSFKMSGSSMDPLIQKEDTVLINQGIFLMGSPKRFDLAYIELEKDRYTIKRIIGMPGETVYIDNGVLYIDGKELQDPYLADEIINGGIASTPLKLKEDEYFVLGDRTSYSEDSRSKQIGPVRRSMLRGKPWAIIFPMNRMKTIR